YAPASRQPLPLWTIACSRRRQKAVSEMTCRSPFPFHLCSAKVQIQTETTAGTVQGSGKMQDHMSLILSCPVLVEIDALPCAKHHPTACNGNAGGGLHERCFDVGRHVVRPLDPMCYPVHGRII